MPAPRRTIAAFDFDGTLTRCDTLPRFIVHAIGRRRFMWAMMRTLPWLAAYRMGLYSNSRAKERLLGACFRGMPKRQFTDAATSFSSTILPSLLRRETVDALDRHIDEGHTVYIVSASLRDWIEPWAATHGVTKVLATEAASDSSGRLTGRFARPNCHGREKVNRILEAEPDRHSYRLVAYGDSSGDTPMLAMADEPHLIHS